MAERKFPLSPASAQVRTETPPPRRAGSDNNVPGRWDRPALMPGANNKPDTVEGKKLLVGRDIALSGEIAACDLLLVEGEINGKLLDGKLLEINETGVFLGEALVDVAQISGRFDGNLTVRDRLLIHPTGLVTGIIRYARIEILSGGEISGDIQVLPRVQAQDYGSFTDAEPEAQPEPAIESDAPADSLNVRGSSV